jgi:alpha-ketoglutarate-dependent taurine dioxygenase
MKYTEPIEYPGIESIIENIDTYKEKFLNDSILVFRNANLNFLQQSDLHVKLEQFFNFYTIGGARSNVHKYEEDHSERELIGIAQSDDILLPWHMEHTYQSNPIVISTWNMINFSTDPENGKTYFIDCQKIYKDMPQNWKDFLINCKINIPFFTDSFRPDDYSAIQNHWLTSNPSIRMIIGKESSKINKLMSVNDNEPTQAQKDLFEEICFWIGNYVYDNEENRIVHKWQQGDLVIPDLFKLAHAVTGGFSPEDRKFIGVWGYKNFKE